ncbi:MAG: hypothetical protein ACQEXB_26785, partial [Bacillota bacterium]
SRLSSKEEELNTQLNQVNKELLDEKDKEKSYIQEIEQLNQFIVHHSKKETNYHQEIDALKQTIEEMKSPKEQKDQKQKGLLENRRKNNTASMQKNSKDIPSKGVNSIEKKKYKDDQQKNQSKFKFPYEKSETVLTNNVHLDHHLTTNKTNYLETCFKSQNSKTQGVISLGKDFSDQNKPNQSLNSLNMFYQKNPIYKKPGAQPNTINPFKFKK